MATQIQLAQSSPSGVATVPNGGTGVATLTAHGVVLGEGAAAVHITAAGATHTVLTGGGAGADPTFVAVDLTNTVSGVLPLANGGTGSATAPDFSSLTGLMKTPTSAVTLFTFLQKQAAGASTNLIADPGDGVAIPVTASGVVSITVGAGVETNTLAAPTFVMQRMTFNSDVNGAGTREVTVSAAFNAAGNTKFKFTAVRQTISLVGVHVGGVLAWAMNANDACTLS